MIDANEAKAIRGALQKFCICHRTGHAYRDYSDVGGLYLEVQDNKDSLGDSLTSDAAGSEKIGVSPDSPFMMDTEEDAQAPTVGNTANRLSTSPHSCNIRSSCDNNITDSENS